MKIEDVARLSPLDRFLYWIRERHNIHLRRQAGQPKPWTDDQVLQRYFFTNPYRENDKTTVWFRENVREPLRNDPVVLFATVCFRWFNYIPTGELLLNHRLLTHWNENRCVQVLKDESKIFTGAYMIKGTTGQRKVVSVCRHVNNVWAARERLISDFEKSTKMEEAHEKLLEFPYLGGFMSYEVVCDLRYTYLLENSTDKCTWCHPGPGAARGLMRLANLTPPKNRFGLQKRHGNPLPTDWRLQMIKLLTRAKSRLKMPMEMREIEHSLCEFDKYERARLNDGKMKRKYPGGTD